MSYKFRRVSRYVTDLLQLWQKAVDNQQVADLQGTIDHLPTFDCADFNLNGRFDAFDKEIYDVFITECLTSSDGCPKTVQDLLNVWPKAVANQQVTELQGEIKHLPRLEPINCTPTPTPTNEIDSGIDLPGDEEETPTPTQTETSTPTEDSLDFGNDLIHHINLRKICSYYK